MSARTNERSEATRQSLISAGGEVFAERGFRSATTREICRRARANSAAVSYHFRGKAGLYLAVLEEAVSTAAEKYPLSMGLGPRPTPRERLRAYVRAFFFRLLDEGRPAWQMKLVIWEMAAPTSALDHLVATIIRPQFEELTEILRDLLRPDEPREILVRYAAGVLAQCVFYRLARPVTDRLDPAQRYDEESIEELADHVFRFSLAAIRARARSKE